MALPPDGRRSAHWDAMAERVIEAGGEWVLVGSGMSAGVPYRIKHGILAAFRPAGRFEVTTRTGQDGFVSVWVRDTLVD